MPAPLSFPSFSLLLTRMATAMGSPMRMAAVTAAIAGASALMSTPVRAEAPMYTGTGGGPGSTMTAPHTTSVGVTKPPGSAAAVGPRVGREARSNEMKRDDKIMKGICIGCGAK